MKTKHFGRSRYTTSSKEVGCPFNFPQSHPGSTCGFCDWMRLDADSARFGCFRRLQEMPPLRSGVIQQSVCLVWGEALFGWFERNANEETIHVVGPPKLKRTALSKPFVHWGPLLASKKHVPTACTKGLHATQTVNLLG